jgi:hypothetical protein
MNKINARKKGNEYETDLAIELREFFPEVVTSRSESKRTDDKGVDFCYTAPFNIQAKAWERAPGYHQVLKDMPKDDSMNVIFHKKNHKGTVVIMSKETFYKIIKARRK